GYVLHRRCEGLRRPDDHLWQLHPSLLVSQHQRRVRPDEHGRRHRFRERHEPDRRHQQPGRQGPSLRERRRHLQVQQLRRRPLRLRGPVLLYPYHAQGLTGQTDKGREGTRAPAAFFFALPNRSRPRITIQPLPTTLAEIHGPAMTEQSSSLESLRQVVHGPGFPAFNRMGVSPAQLQQILETGIAHHKEARKEEAERCYRQVLEIAPNQPDALNLLGVLAADAGLLGLSIDLMRKALTLRPKDPNILNNLGHALSETHQYEEARDKLEQAVALKPDFDEAKYNLGKALRFLGETELALKWWKEVWEADDRVYAALVGITNIYADEGRFEEAETTAREVKKRLPHRPAGYISFAHIHKFREDDGTLAEIKSQLTSENIAEQDKVA